MTQPDNQQAAADALAALVQRRGGLPGDRIIPTEYQELRGSQQRTGPMAQAAMVEGMVPTFLRKVGLEPTVERTDTGWTITVPRPEPEQQADGVKVDS